MTIIYENIKPWGRNLSEYMGMFALTESDLQKNILGCSDGPASFNAEMTAKGQSVISVDPIYGMTASQIESRVNETWGEILEQVENNMEMFVWEKFKSPQELGQARLAAMKQFIADYDQGKQQGRYIEASLPKLPFEDHQFDLALCSNFLFLYDEHFSDEFHVEAVRELCRVAKEVRIFPIHGLQNTLAQQVYAVQTALQEDGWLVERVKVDYEFRYGSNQMMRLSERLQAYKQMWTNVGKYVLVEIPDENNYTELRKIHTHIVYEKYPVGYVRQDLMPQDAQTVIDKMLASGVQVRTQDEIDDASQPYHLWTDKKHEYLLVPIDDDATKFSIFSKEFNEFIVIHFWDVDFEGWDEITQKMKSAGVEIATKEKALELTEQHNNKIFISRMMR